MNEFLTLDEPAGEGWRFSLNGTDFQSTRTFQTDAAGNPFVDGKDYTIWAYHEAQNVRLSEKVTYWGGPVNYTLLPDRLVPDLRRVTRRGAVTPDLLTVGGLQSDNFPTVTDATLLFVGKPGTNGLIQLAKISLAQLAKVLAPYLNLADVAPLPAYVPVQIWRAVKNVDGSPLPALPAYVPVQIWRAKANAQLQRPAAPSNLTVELVAGSYRLRFTDNATNEASFRLERKTGSGSYEPYLTLAMDQTLTGPMTDLVVDTLYTWRVLATNAAGDSPWSGEATLRIPPANRAPQAPALEDRTFTAGVAVDFVLPPFTDPDGDALTYTAQNLPSGLNFDETTRRVTGTPLGDTSRAITYGASDGRGASALVQPAPVWTVKPANNPPVAPSLPAQTFTRGQAAAYTHPAFTDPDGDAVTVSVSSLPPGLSYANGQLSGTPTQVGLFTITYTARDGKGGEKTAAQTIEVIEPAANRAPQAPDLPTLIDIKGQPVDRTLPPFVDPDGDTLTYSVPDGMPAGLSFDPLTRRVTGTPLGSGTISQVNYTVKYAATDAQGATTTGSFTWRINS